MGRCGSKATISAGPATDYFQNRYAAGELYRGSRKYVLRVDRKLRLSVLLHVESGIMVWSEAVDLRASAPDASFRVLYHYMPLSKITSLFGGCKKELEIFAALCMEVGDFGRGMYASAKEPDVFGSKAAVLINNHWPHSEHGAQNGIAAANQVQLQAGPEDPQNKAVCSHIVETMEHNAELCVPVLVPECFAYNIWERATPEQAEKVDVGCNRYGDKQWDGRDIWVVQLTDAGLSNLNNAGVDSKVDMFWKRLAHLEKVKGVHHPDTLSSLNDLACLFRTMDMREKAEPLFRGALKGRTEKLGPTHPDTLTSMNDLAMLLKSSGQYVDAEALLRSALEGREEKLGADHPDTLTSLNNLASLLKANSNLSEAEPLYRRALQGSEDLLGHNHANTLTILNNLGVLLQAMKKYQEAEPLLQRCLEGRQVALRPSHPDTLQSINTLGVLQKDMGKYHQAQPLLRQAFKGREAALGSQHEDTLQTLNSLASLFQAMGQHNEAEHLLRQLLACREATLEPNHPLTLQALSCLAVPLQAMGRYAEAEPLLRRVLEIREASLGTTHQDTLASLNALAVLLYDRGKYEEAEPLLRRAHLGRERLHGEKHEQTLQSVNDLAMVLQALGKFKDAESLYRRALEARKASLGGSHRDTIQSANNLAMLLKASKKFSEAEKLYHSALESSESALGSSHPQTITIRNNLTTLFAAVGRRRDAEALYRRALEKSEAIAGPSDPNTLQSLKDLATVMYATQYSSSDHRVGKPFGSGSKSSSNNEYSTPRCRPPPRKLEYGVQDVDPISDVFGEGSLLDTEVTLAPTNLCTLTIVNNLAAQLKQAGRYKEAEVLFRRALEGREVMLGENHLNTLRSKRELGMVLLAVEGEDHRAEAEALLRRVMEGRLFLRGSSDVDTLQSQEDLAFALQLLRRFGEAEELRRAALVGREKLQGPTNPETLRSMNSFGMLLHATGCADKQREAVSVLRRALKERETMLGPDHPDTIQTLENLGLTLQAETIWMKANTPAHLEKTEEAEKLLRRANASREALLGIQHPDTILSSQHLATVLKTKSKYEDVQKLKEHRLTKLMENSARPQHLSPKEAASADGEIATPVQHRRLSGDIFSKHGGAITEDNVALHMI